MEKIKISIVSGNYPPGSKIPSVRELAVQYEVNPNTMQKSLTKLEDIGLLYSVRTSGRFVTENSILIDYHKKELPNNIISKFLIEMNELGISNNDICLYIEKYLQENNQKENIQNV